MRPETAEMLLRQVAAAQPSAVSFLFQGGEPTLAGPDFYAHFTQRAAALLSVPVSYAIQTNGLLLDDAFARLLREHGFLVGLSLDGGRKTNDRYRRDAAGNSVLPQVLTAAKTLEKHGVPFNILSVIDDANAAEIDRTYAYFKKHGFYDLQFIPYVDEQAEIALSPAAYEAFLKRLFDLWYADFDPAHLISIRHLNNYIDILAGYPPENCAMCGVCGHYYVVEANGDLYPCDFYCTPAEKLGSIFDPQPFEMNEKQRAFIAQSEIIHAHCRGCKYYALCRGGCKRDRINGFTENQYCAAYTGFFDYALDRLIAVTNILKARL